MPRLVVEKGKSAGAAVELERPVVIGRGDGTQLKLDDTKASREHCKVFEQGGAWIVVDLNSRNGISVNGVKTTRRNLQDGDRIEVGESTLVFHGGAAAKSAAAAAPARAPEPERPARETAPAAAAKTAPAPAVAKAPAPSRAEKPKPEKDRGGRKDAAFAAARAEQTGRAQARAAKAAGAGEGGIQVSDRVLQYNKIDARKGGVLDVDMAQSPGTTKLLITIGCLAFLGGVLWLVLALMG